MICNAEPRAAAKYRWWRKQLHGILDHREQVPYRAHAKVAWLQRFPEDQLLQ